MMAPVRVARLTMNFGLKRSLRVPERVGQHEAAFGVGVEHLDGLARHRGDDVARPLRVAVGHVLDQPMTPTALTLALRAASACMRPMTAAAPPMSPFMSSMPAAGLIEMPPVSKTTPLPMKAIGLSFGLAAVPLHDDQRGGRAVPWPTPSSAPMPSLLHLLLGQHLDLDAERSSSLARAANSSG